MLFCFLIKVQRSTPLQKRTVATHHYNIIYGYWIVSDNVQFAQSHYFSATAHKGMFDLWHVTKFQPGAICIFSLRLIFLRMSPGFGGCLPCSCSDTDLILPHLLNSHLGPVCFHNCLSLFVYHLSFQLCDCCRPPPATCVNPTCSLLCNPARPPNTLQNTVFSGTFSWASEHFY